MKKYYYSFAVHVLLLLLLLSFGRWKVESNKSLEQVIIVDFSKRPNYSAPKSTVTKPKSKTVKKAEPKVKPRKEKTTPTSQKPKEQSKSTEAASEAKNKVKIAQEKAALQAAQKLAEEQRQKKSTIEKAKKAKLEKVDYFKNLFKSSVAKSKVQEELEEREGHNKVQEAEVLSKDKSLSGAISNRSVIKKPTIRDNTQKEGRVIVKICVDSSGKVISSTYTQIGSTTADAHLIELAEKGALQFQFSESDVFRQCGRVIIDFTLKA